MSQRSRRRFHSGCILRRALCATALLFILATPGGRQPAAGMVAAHKYDWLQFDGDEEHSGDNTAETTITPANVHKLRPLFTYKLPSTADAPPVYLSDVKTSTGVRDLLFFATKQGHIIALDALSGDVVWIHQNGPGTCIVNRGQGPLVLPCYTTSSPVIDPDRRYVYSYGLDGYVHKYRVGDGEEIRGGGWPELGTRKGFDEKHSSDLSTATAKDGTSYLYVTFAGYPSFGDFQGHVTTINLRTGTQHTFNVLCSNLGDVHFYHAPSRPDCPRETNAGVWGRPGVVYDPDTGRIYLATGNGLFDPARHDWGDTVLALHPDGTGLRGNPLDSYTPVDSAYLDKADLDLGSVSPVILPAPPHSTIRHLGLQGGKDGRLRLLNLDNLSGHGGAGHVGGEVGPVIPVPQGGMILATPAVWTNPRDGRIWVFVASYAGLSGLQVTTAEDGTPRLRPIWRRSNNGPLGTSPLVANGVLYYVVDNDLEALDPTTGRVLWRDTAVHNIHWESPVVDNGVLYVSDWKPNDWSRVRAYAVDVPPPLTVTITSRTVASRGPFGVRLRTSPRAAIHIALDTPSATIHGRHVAPYHTAINGVADADGLYSGTLSVAEDAPVVRPAALTITVRLTSTLSRTRTIPVTIYPVRR